MTTKKHLVIGLTVMGAVTVAPEIANAQVPPDSVDTVVANDAILDGVTVHLIVDGMVCPFCAYGLEKRLGKLAGVDSVSIRISDGLVQIREKEGALLTQAILKREVERAGFTLREMKRLDR